MKRVVSVLLVLAMVLVPVFALTSCGEDDSIKVGFVGPLTGSTAEYGEAVRNGIQLYLDKLNAAGGIAGGKQVKLVAYDSKGDVTDAVNLYNRLVERDGIVALLGAVLTAETLVIRSETAKVNLPQITGSATDAKVTVDPDTGKVYTNVFRTCFIDPFQGEKMADYVADKLGAKKAAVIYQSGSAYSEGLKDAFVAECEKLGVSVVDVEAYSSGDVDFNAQLTNIKNAGADVVFSSNYYEDDAMIVSQARKLGITAPFCGGDGWSSISAYADAADLEGCLYISSFAKGATPEIVAFEEEYKAKFGIEPTMFAALAYDAAMLMANALEKAEEKGLERGSDAYKQFVIDTIRDGSGDIDGITSDGYHFDENNNPIKSAVIMECKGGEEVYKETY